MNKIMGPDSIVHTPAGDLVGPPAALNFAITIRMGFPDVIVSVLDLICENESVGVRWVLSGTQSEHYEDQSPTGQSVTVSGQAIFHFHDGRIVEIWLSYDPAALLGYPVRTKTYSVTCPNCSNTFESISPLGKDKVRRVMAMKSPFTIAAGADADWEMNCPNCETRIWVYWYTK